MNLFKIYFQSKYWIIPLLWIVTVVVNSRYFGSSYSPDSYSYYMLGENLFSGNGYTERAIRELNEDHGSSSIAFPPLFPILAGLTNLILNTKIASGFIINLFVLYGIFHIIYLLAKKISPRFFYIPLVLSFVFISKNLQFLEEIISGRSIPLSFLILLAIIYVSAFYEDKHSIIGILLGSLYLTRFDTILFCFSFPLFVCIIKKENYKKSLYTYLSFFLIISPWLIRNYYEFGKLFVSGSQINVFSITVELAQLSYFKTGVPLFNMDPQLWLEQRIYSLVESLKAVYSYLAPYNCGAVVLFIFTLSLRKKDNRELFIFSRISLLYVFLNIITVSLAKHHFEHRYFSPSVFLIILSSIFFLVSQKKNLIEFKKDIPNIGLGSMIISIILCFIVFAIEYKDIVRDKNSTVFLDTVKKFSSFISSSDLVGVDIVNDNFAYYSKNNYVLFPFNVSSFKDDNLIAWKNHFKVNYVIVYARHNFDYSGFKPVSECNGFLLFDISNL